MKPDPTLSSSRQEKLTAVKNRIGGDVFGEV
jgi:hypothetical protein